VTTRFAGGPGESPGFLLWHATLEWQRTLTAALKPLGLTHVQFVLLACTWWLARQGEAPRQVDVARQAGTDVKMTSEVLRKLEAAGLVERTTPAHDTRSRLIEPTPAGRRLAQQAIRVVEKADAAFFDSRPELAAALLARD